MPEEFKPGCARPTGGPVGETPPAEEIVDAEPNNHGRFPEAPNAGSLLLQAAGNLPASGEAASPLTAEGKQEKP